MTTKVRDEVTVDVPVNLAYNQWTQFEEFPQFMDGVLSVDQVTDSRLHWVAEVAGVRREWDAEILEQLPDRKVAWAATDGATNAGAVYFESVEPGRTRVRLELEFEPEGLVEKVGDALGVVERQATNDLARFKSFIEDRNLPTGGWRGQVNPGTRSARRVPARRRGRAATAARPVCPPPRWAEQWPWERLRSRPGWPPRGQASQIPLRASGVTWSTS
jgi:uncharacterized membrane protein